MAEITLDNAIRIAKDNWKHCRIMTGYRYLNYYAFFMVNNRWDGDPSEIPVVEGHVAVDRKTGRVGFLSVWNNNELDYDKAEEIDLSPYLSDEENQFIKDYEKAKKEYDERIESSDMLEI